MQVTDGPLAGLKIIKLDIYGDARGFFIERFHTEKFAAFNMPTYYAQDNHSRSSPGILRGLHYQHTPPQGKLVGAVRGRIWDVAVDIRPHSPTYGKHFAIELSDANATLLWVPAGFAHGFCVLGDESADVMYKVSGLYSAGGEGGIAYNDPDLAIDWPVKNPTLSNRDMNQQSFAAYKANPPKWEGA